MGNQGTLTVGVWPPYIGLARDHPDDEPYQDENYARGQIFWRTLADFRIVGRAKCAAPKGIYRHLVFFNGPNDDSVAMDVKPLEHPIVFDRPGFIEIDPIQIQNDAI